jgi:hypothetical protein
MGIVKMNERIRELATEVGISYDYLNNTKQWVLIEALAERIVRECIAKCDDLNSMKYIADHFEIKIEGLNNE